MSLQGSLSSISPPTAGSDFGDGSKKKFACSWRGCGKSFSRSEHLHRHALNHKEGNNTCPRCAAHFRRHDLLDRHMMRHKQKDDEAGGEGLGHLATRKRLWRDSNGDIVNARRPYFQEKGKRQRLSPLDEDGDTIDHHPNKSSKLRSRSSPSPHQSIKSTTNKGVERFEDHNLFPESWDTDVNPMQYESFDFLCNAGWGGHQYQNEILPSSDLPYDDIFKPDTAMSFNAPFTTLNYYSWLFGSEDSNNVVDASVSLQHESAAVPMGGDSSATAIGTGYPHGTNMQLQSGSHSIANSSGIPASINAKYNNHENMFTLVNKQSSHGPVNLSYQDNHFFSTTMTGGGVTSGSQSNPFLGDVHEIVGNFNYTPSTSSGSDQNDPTPSSASNSAVTMASLSSQDWTTPMKSSPSQVSSSPDKLPALCNGIALPDAYVASSAPKLPVISSEARDSLMREICQSQPTRPSGSEILSSDRLLSLSSLQHYCDLFFTRFNTSYPLIHQASFNADNVHIFLLMSILLLGATYSDKEAHLLAVCIHDIMRPLIHSSKEFSTRPKLWMLQTILLVECFGKSRAGEKQHDMSHLYHGLLINLIRRSDCQIACIPPYDAQIHDVEEYWQLSVEAEQKRRLAMLCFMWDTQHAVLFSQSLCMNASELKLTLPWDNAIWEASSASEWLRLSHSVHSPPQYLSILKMYTDPSTSTTPINLNALSRVLIFHGLMSISWDLNRRDQTSSSLFTSSSVPWQLRMAKCYAQWQFDFESYTSSVLNSLSFDSKHRAKFQRFSIANMAVYHTAQLILDVDITDLQIHAGARHIIGRQVTVTDRARSKAKIQEWMSRNRGKQAGNATWHATRLFRDGVRKLENWNVDEMFHYPWCLYLATLTCWAFHNAAQQESHPSSLNTDAINSSLKSSALQIKASSNSIVDEDKIYSTHAEDVDDEDSDWDSRVEMNALISAVTKLDPTKDSFAKEIWEAGRKFKTQGLLKCMVKHLNTVRWAVVREGMVVLRGLIH